MTYATREDSRYGALPYELFRFTSNGAVWRYTSADQPIVHEGETYAAVAIARGEVSTSQEDASQAVEVSMDASLSLARPIVAGTPAPVLLSLIRGHRGTEGVVIRRYRVATSRQAEGRMHLMCTPFAAQLQRSVPGRVYQRLCGHALYGTGCGVDPTSFQAEGTVFGYGGRTVIVTAAAAQDDGYYTAGFLTRGGAYAFIESHAGDELTLLSPVDWLAAGDPVTLFAGCDRAVTTCHEKFANSARFGGMPLIPIENPFRDGL